MLTSIAHQFSDKVKQITPLGHGLINDTFLVSTDSKPFVLQRINRTVFKEPEQIMANLVVLNQHLVHKNQAGLKLEIPRALATKDQVYFYRDESGDYWRALSFIANSMSLETLRSIHDAEQIGYALGSFHCLFSDLDPELLHDTLPDFHIAPRYLNRYQQALSGADKTYEDPYCADFIEQYQNLINDLEAAKLEGLLPLRVIHGDPKLNNFLFAEDKGQVIGLVDLDTVKPGLVHYDLGDCLRSCCHQTPTNTFDLDVCAAILKSYLSAAGDCFSEADYRFLYPAIRLIPFELGIRFYTDYLHGNRYFKVNAPLQNLKRATAQFELCADIIKQEQTIVSLINDLKLYSPRI